MQMNQLINPATLKALRETKGLTQDKLVELVNRIGRGRLDKRQLQRIEGKARLPGPHYVREKTLLALARALSVSPAELQSAPEDSPAAPAEVDERLPLPVKVRPATVTKLDLIRSAYKVSLEEIIDLAPLMFAYHAESSLRERKQRLEGNLQLRERFLRAFPEMQHLLEEGEQATPSKLQSEHMSLRGDDIFGMWLDPEVFDGIELGDNPFAEYLQRLSAEFAAPSKLEVDDLPALLALHAETRIPDYTVCTEHLDWLTQGDPELKMAILNRELLIDNVPLMRLLGDAADRVAWMRRELQQQRAAKASNSGHGGQSKPEQSVE
jgi:transcriptional regulator with XRE-family HTH domain